MCDQISVFITASGHVFTKIMVKRIGNMVSFLSARALLHIMDFMYLRYLVFEPEIAWNDYKSSVLCYSLSEQAPE